MARISLRILHLAQPLAYSELPPSDSGAESLIVFGKEELIEETRNSGPKVRNPLPQPIFRGLRSNDVHGGAKRYLVEPGDYLFAQWRPGDYPTLSEALEDLALQVWWEGHRTQGPWMVRKLEEDGQIALQCWISCPDYSRTP